MNFRDKLPVQDDVELAGLVDFFVKLLPVDLPDGFEATLFALRILIVRQLHGAT